MRHKRSVALVCTALVLAFAVAAHAWEEPELEAIMARAARLEEQVRKGLTSDKSAAAEAATNVAALFDDVRNFWERKGVESAQERAVASLIERGDFDGAKLAAKNMNANCQGCHVASGVAVTNRSPVGAACGPELTPKNGGALH